jgi:hypothetical protein
MLIRRSEQRSGKMVFYISLQIKVLYLCMLHHIWLLIHMLYSLIQTYLVNVVQSVIELIFCFILHHGILNKLEVALELLVLSKLKIFI